MVSIDLRPEWLIWWMNLPTWIPISVYFLLVLGALAWVWAGRVRTLVGLVFILVLCSFCGWVFLPIWAVLLTISILVANGFILFRD
jgi:hypothetical protein